MKNKKCTVHLIQSLERKDAVLDQGVHHHSVDSIALWLNTLLMVNPSADLFSCVE